MKCADCGHVERSHLNGGRCQHAVERRGEDGAVVRLACNCRSFVSNEEASVAEPSLDDLDSLSFRELQALAKERGLRAVGVKKEALLAALRG